ncbi:hypothetical protein PR048_000270 [Dryococelus australis]|uniref:Uncharacterized protein n=1 Tax=Dryococelus australis TaxID=614101 RepID=A0ABQ9IE73_9NEOP|nr:hypothetical protein PR048_000270 [Dryococelus australis]
MCVCVWTDKKAWYPTRRVLPYLLLSCSTGGRQKNILGVTDRWLKRAGWEAGRKKGREARPRDEESFMNKQKREAGWIYGRRRRLHPVFPEQLRGPRRRHTGWLPPDWGDKGEIGARALCPITPTRKALNCHAVFSSSQLSFRQSPGRSSSISLGRGDYLGNVVHPTTRLRDLLTWRPEITARSQRIESVRGITAVGAAKGERLACSPPTKANRARSPAGSPDLRKWESCRTIPLVGGGVFFVGDLPSSETDLLTNSQCYTRTEDLPRRRYRGENPRPSDYMSAALPLSY